MTGLYHEPEVVTCMRSAMRRNMIRWTVALFFLVIGICFCLYWTSLVFFPFNQRDCREQHKNRMGLIFLHHEYMAYNLENKTNIIKSFTQLFDIIKTEKPEITGKIDDPNPFPGILLADHTYARVLELPHGLEPNTVPLIWDTKPGNEGWIAVLFWDGSLPQCMDIKHLEQILATVKQHGGRISEGTPKIQNGKKN